MFDFTARSRATLVAISLISLPSFSQAQSEHQPISETSLEIVQFAGVLHATALMCEAYSEQKMLGYKRAQKDRMVEQGMEEEAFYRAFAKGLTEAEQRWDTLSDAEKKQACAEIENQMSDMTPPAR